MNAPNRLTSRWFHASRLWSAYLEARAQDGLPFPQFDRWLSAKLKEHKDYGKKDRQWYSEALFASLRFGVLAAFLEHAREGLATSFRARTGQVSKRQLDELLASFAAKDSPEGYLATWKAMDPARFFFWVSRRAGIEPAPAVPEEGAAKVYDGWASLLGDETSGPGALIWNGIPPSLGEALSARARASGWTPEDQARFVRSHSSRPPIWLRLSSPHHRETVTAELKAAGLDPKAGPGDSLRIQGERSLFELEGFKTGRFEIQDLGSQLEGASVPAGPGDRVWDACAGGGGKTLQLAAALKNEGAVHASDIREHKLAELKDRVRRAGFHNVRTFAWDASGTPPLALELQSRGGYDAVLVDAPCSSCGTWRRNPDSRFRMTSAEAVAGFAELQLKILRAAAGAVRPGGVLVYGTCSWRVEENEGVRDAFLAAETAFQPTHHGLVGNPPHDSDTFYAASFKRG